MRPRYGDWVQTLTGHRFYVLDPYPEDILIEDISGSLSRVCRFGGHPVKFYCPTPEQRILTSDLRWVPAGNLQVGDELIGFDETPFELGSGGHRRRRFRPSTVLAHVPVKRRVIRLELKNGLTIRSSEEHPWLVATKQSRNQAWLTARQIAKDLKDGRRRYLHQFVNPWVEQKSYEAGWLSGIYDGEGTFSAVNRRGSQLSVSQKPGLVLDRILEVSNRLGHHVIPRPPKNSGVVAIQTVGGWREVLKTLGALQPVRLLNDFKESLQVAAKQFDGIGHPEEIVRAYYEGYQECSGIETSTRTYFCEGFGAHNSVAQHCVLGSHVVEEKTKDLMLTLAFLLHDSGEAYLGDMTRPLKSMPEMEAFRAAERKLNRTIERRFNLPDGILDDKVIREVDNRMLFTEKRDLLVSLDWGHSCQPFDFKIKPWSWREAETRYLNRYHELCLRLDGYPKVTTQLLKLVKMLNPIGTALSTREQTLLQAVVD